MKKYLALTLTLALSVSMLAGCAKKEETPQPTTTNETAQTQPVETTKTTEPAEGEQEQAQTQIANPWTTHETLDDAIKASGIPLRILNSIDEAVPIEYRTMDGVIEVIYGVDGQSVFYLRKGANETDVSGVYETYATTVTQDVEGDGWTEQVTLSGNGEMFALAQWVEGGQAFSLYAEQPAEIAVIAIAVDNLVKMNHVGNKPTETTEPADGEAAEGEPTEGEVTMDEALLESEDTEAYEVVDMVGEQQSDTAPEA